VSSIGFRSEVKGGKLKPKRSLLVSLLRILVRVERKKSPSASVSGSAKEAYSEKRNTWEGNSIVKGKTKLREKTE